MREYFNHGEKLDTKSKGQKKVILYLVAQQILK